MTGFDTFIKNSTRDFKPGSLYMSNDSFSVHDMGTKRFILLPAGSVIMFLEYKIIHSERPFGGPIQMFYFLWKDKTIELNINHFKFQLDRITNFKKIKPNPESL